MSYDKIQTKIKNERYVAFKLQSKQRQKWRKHDKSFKNIKYAL